MSRLRAPGGEDRGETGEPATHEAILRLAWSLSLQDDLVVLLDGDQWVLAAIRAGLEGSGVQIMGSRGSDTVSSRDDLMELAVLELWDDGWFLEKPPLP